MEREQSRTIEAVQFAIQMEIDGKEYYQRASQKSSNRLTFSLGRVTYLTPFSLRR
jgi:hypothetical protein